MSTPAPTHFYAYDTNDDSITENGQPISYMAVIDSGETTVSHVKFYSGPQATESVVANVTGVNKSGRFVVIIRGDDVSIWPAD